MFMRLRAVPTRITRISIVLYTLRGLLTLPRMCVKKKKKPATASAVYQKKP